jgi:SAM-dependent methyltransferase
MPAGCRGSGTPAALRWLARTMGLGERMRLVDSGAGVGGPSELAAREHGVSPFLVDPMVGACRAASRLFGRPVAAADGERLPFPDDAFDAGWCLGVLCTVADKAPVLAELRRVVRSGGPVGLLVFLRNRATLPDQPEGNHFPDRDELTGLLTGAGLRVIEQAPLADFPEPSKDWKAQVAAVEAVIERDHGRDDRFATAKRQEESIGRLLADGLVTGHLVVTRVGDVPAPAPTD